MPVRDEKHMQEQKKRIIDAAFRCFSQEGLQKTSIRAICKEAGLSVGAIYTHFKDRDDIIASMKLMAYESPLEELSVQTWQEFEDLVVSAIDIREHPENLEYIICDLKLTAEALGNDNFAKLFRESAEESLAWMEKSLRVLNDNKLIELPIGVSDTARAIRYFTGGAATSLAFESTDQTGGIVNTFRKSLRRLVVIR